MTLMFLLLAIIVATAFTPNLLAAIFAEGKDPPQQSICPRWARMRSAARQIYYKTRPGTETDNQLKVCSWARGGSMACALGA
jgi:hypothetical protein